MYNLILKKKAVLDWKHTISRHQQTSNTRRMQYFVDLLENSSQYSCGITCGILVILVMIYLLTLAHHQAERAQPLTLLNLSGYAAHRDALYISRNTSASAFFILVSIIDW